MGRESANRPTAAHPHRSGSGSVALAHVSVIEPVQIDALQEGLGWGIDELARTASLQNVVARHLVTELGTVEVPPDTDPLSEFVQEHLGCPDENLSSMQPPLVVSQRLEGVHREVRRNPVRPRRQRIGLNLAPQCREVVIDAGLRITKRHPHHPAEHCLQHHPSGELISGGGLGEESAQSGIRSQLHCGQTSSSDSQPANASYWSAQRATSPRCRSTSTPQSRLSASTT